MNKNNFADIEYSKKLAHLFQDAEWWWFYTPDNTHKIVYIDIKNCGYTELDYPAVTSDMAMEKLPHGITLHKYAWGYECFLTVDKSTKGLNVFKNKKLSNALCKMLIYLDKKGLLK